MKTKQICLLLFFLFMLLWNCTENPFGNETKISGNSISGIVALNNHSNPEDIHVWLKALDRRSRTDKNGFFSLQLPISASQPGGGLSGIHDLNFYVANYQFETIQILIINGKIGSSGQYLNENGELLRKPFVLSEILNITTSFSRIISINNTVTFTALFTVKAIRDPVWVTANYGYKQFSDDPDFMSGYLLDSNKQCVKFLKVENRDYRSSNLKIDNSSSTLMPIEIHIEAGELAPGIYEVVPHLVIQQEHLPAGLINDISEDARKFGLDFLKIPMKIENNKFEHHTP